jgi:hypothetical protein
MVKGSCKKCKVEWNVCQGLNSLIERFRNNPVMHEAVPEDHKPVYFIDGVEEPFPAPTKPLKAPRLRKPTSKALKALKA